jgi:hypothetical protein
LGTKNKHFSLRYLAKKGEKAKNKERFHEEAVLYFLKNHELLKLLRLIVWRWFSYQQFNGTILLFCDDQHPYRTL